LADAPLRDDVERVRDVERLRGVELRPVVREAVPRRAAVERDVVPRRERLVLVLRRRPLVARSLRGISALTTSFTSCGISRSR
jgi:hypothetical protein